MPREVGINLSPYHFHFLLLPASLIKLPPSYMHTEAHFQLTSRHALCRSSYLVALYKL